MGKHGQDRGKDREGRQHPGKPRTQQRSGARQRDDEHCCDQHACGEIPASGCWDLGEIGWKTRWKRQCGGERRLHHQHERPERHLDRVQKDDTGDKGAGAGRERDRPGEAPSGAAVGAKSGLRGGAGKRSCGRGCGKAPPLVDGKKERDWPRGQRQAYQPTADGRSPPPAGEARGLDQERAGRGLEDQRVRSPRGFSFRSLGTRGAAIGAAGESRDRLQSQWRRSRRCRQRRARCERSAAPPEPYSPSRRSPRPSRRR